MNEQRVRELRSLGICNLAREMLYPIAEYQNTTYQQMFYSKDARELQQFVLYVVLDSVQE
mgnify:CR=1 FL=1